ncbi:hypothetical protein [Fluviispira vulneris]|uniref:hypothetical protein n=1 Tax=Fluviispira vulneris TaxID=2763012 RepID=UPI0016488B1B|nr:hypothetical protein [Fluviispira vulneris]
MRDVQWNRLENNIFSIYYDENAAPMGEYSLKSLQYSYPYLSLLLGVKLPNDAMPLLNSQKDRFLISEFDKISVILGGRFEGPGFANPINMSIEAQMIHSRGAAFFQHELVHRLMYEHNDFNIGPAGRIFSLAMFPTWWIEGLAEHLTESVGSTETDAIARSMALQDNWPTWERMHALYNADGDTNLRGYVASGRFLRWIFEKVTEKDLYKIHSEISKETRIPPFYSATDVWLYKTLGKNGESLYEEFKIEQKKEWENYLVKMPSLLNSSLPSSEESYYFPAVVHDNKLIFSNLTAEKYPLDSALQVYDFSTQKSQRLPLSVSGSSLFALSESKNGILLTAERKDYSNASYGHKLRVIKFKGDISQLNNENIESDVTREFSTQENPFVIDEIKSFGNGEFYLSASLNGNQSIYFFNALKDELKFIKKFNFPNYAQFLSSNLKENNDKKCLIYILNKDSNKTSLQKLCKNLSETEILGDNKFFIKEGYVLKNGNYRLLVDWNRVLSLIELSPGQKITTIAAFPEWVQGLVPWNGDNNDFLGAWVYKNQNYHFSKIDLKKLKTEYTAWQSKLKASSPFLNHYQFKKYIPPFQAIYDQKKYSLLGEDVNLYEDYVIKNKENIAKIDLSKQKEQTNYTYESASYRNNFLFAYPYFQPNFLGGPSIGVFAVPFIDEMGRYRIQIFGGYNFYLDAPSGAITYINNRIFDAFSLSLFSSPLFNGYYDLKNNQSDSETRYFNYLQQNGLLFSFGLKFLPSTVTWQNSLMFSNIQPYSALRVDPTSIGAQTTNLISATTSLSVNLFKKGFYLEVAEKTHGQWLLWNSNLKLGLGKFNSIGGALDSAGKSVGDLDYFNVNASLSTSVSLYNQNISVLASISTTQGNNTFNLKEIYSPFQGYILGENVSLSYLSFPIVGSGTLLDLRAGYWSYSGSLTYDFPLSNNFESKLLMAYLNDWRGFISLKEGGVSDTPDFSTFNSVTSIGIGSGLTMDIKGFQIFPSLIYGYGFGEKSWYVLTQVKFTDIL